MSLRVDHQGFVCTMTLARPEKLNALNRAVLEELRDAVRTLSSSQTRCLIITGEGKAFVAGADISELHTLNPSSGREMAALGHNVLDAIEALPFPVIAAVNGFALGGGCELMLACDFAYASTTAKLGQPEVKLGIIPGFGGTQRLARRVGIARARELIYSGVTLSAEEALRIGLVNQVCAPEELLPSARKTAELIASVAPVAIQHAKRVIREGEGLPLREANRLEIVAFAQCFTSADQKEGMSAFLEKRVPKFTGS